MTKEDLLDALAELKHDLGKYILLPVSFLPEDASQSEVRAALETALMRTRVTPRGGVRGAEDLWSAFSEECRESLGPLQSFEELQAVVVRALSWAERLTNPVSSLDRAALQADLAEVSAAIARVIEEVEGG
ncbi:MAG: hypothetical protein MUC50_11855 [Myxococcota bacterium]|jgi:hypothetical protein|nr:hypothetical protein [Myxococcota bacterium]